MLYAYRPCSPPLVPVGALVILGSFTALQESRNIREYENIESCDPVSGCQAGWILPALPLGMGLTSPKKTRRASLAAGFDEQRFEVPGRQCSAEV